MLGFFPTPYPDETLYSVVSRYIDILKPKAVSPVYLQLFGLQDITWPVTGIPVSTNTLISRLPIGHSYTLESIVSNHSLIPYYEPFLPPKRIEKLIYNGEAISAIFLQEKSTLKCCPICVKFDKTNYGEPYWHRAHQVPGVFVCPTHNVFLTDTHLPLIGRIHCTTLAKILQQNPPSEVNVLDNFNIIHSHLQNIAEDSFWLLSNRQPGRDLPSLRKNIKLLFNNTSWVSDVGFRLRLQVFAEAFTNHYSGTLLDQLNCSLQEKNMSWLNIITQDRTRQHVVNPLRYLLLFRFLGQSAESFFTSNKARSLPANPFGSGPWPCLNPVANHFKENTIPIVRYDEARKDSPGTFECPLCGYTYMYRAPSPHKIKVVKHGPVWEKRLLKMVEDPSMTYRSIGRIFSLDHSVIVRHVQKLRNRNLHIEQPQKEKDSASIELRRQRYREIWKNNYGKNPNLSITELARKVPSAYAWLSKNDRQWHNDHKPPSKRSVKIDWKSKDEELLILAQKTVLSLLSYPRPIRLTRTQILREMGPESHGNNLSKLPLTKQYIDSSVESHEAFTIRRIKLAAEQFIEEEIIPSSSELRTRAGIKPHWVNRIGNQIDEILNVTTEVISQQNNFLNEAAVITDVNKEFP